MTITINTKTDLTYEEIYEGHANGKSRLPKVLKDIEAGNGDFATLANGSTPLGDGVDILRRRTGGGNATDVSGIGISVVDPVAKLISAARYDSLFAGYSPSGGEPSQNFIDADVRGVTKNPFDLIDFVSGIDNADQLKGSGDALATRAAKLKAIGSNVVTRDFTELIQEANYDVRVKFGDRVGGGGATGEVHGVDQGIAGILENTGSQAKIVGSVDGSSGLDMSADTTLSLDINRGEAVSIVYPSATLSLAEVSQETNADLAGATAPASDGAAFVIGDNLVVRSDVIGGDGKIISDANAAIGFASGTVFGQTAGAYGLDGNDEIITVPTEALDVQNRIRYQTFQFGTLRIFTSINDADPVAYIVHPDLLDDLVANNP